jgi:hypothetical protein
MGPPKEVFSEEPPQPVAVNAIAKIIAEMDTDRIRDCIVTIAPFQTSLTRRRRNHSKFPCVMPASLLPSDLTSKDAETWAVTILKEKAKLGKIRFTFGITISVSSWWSWIGRNSVRTNSYYDRGNRPDAPFPGCHGPRGGSAP